jgi:serine phosphatase RsbU (regulator of sigma subunit)
MSAGQLSAVRYGSATSTLSGHTRSGDLEVVHVYADGALMAVVDGVGHGDSAALAAENARMVIQSHALEPLTTVLRHCHEELRFTRGVVMSLAAIDFRCGQLTWLGVGNVRGVLYRADGASGPRREELLLRPGVVGAKMPALRATVTTVSRGDMVILATDGVRSDFADAPMPSAEPQALAMWLLAQYGQHTDDALVLVVQVN